MNIFKSKTVAPVIVPATKDVFNEVTLVGKIKNVKSYSGDKGTMITGWFDQREGASNTYVVGINIVALDKTTVGGILGVTRAGTEQSDLITIKGRLVTRFDRRQDVSEDARRAPQLQLQVLEVQTA